jgi:hypothetical protein
VNLLYINHTFFYVETPIPNIEEKCELQDRNIEEIAKDFQKKKK